MKNEKKLLVLLDMHAILHRGYHALPDFQTNSGQPTGALYGLTSMLIGIINELTPDYLVGCYDLPKPTKRHELFADYKAGRKPTDDALVTQIKQSRELLNAFGIEYYEQEGYEADDLLGTIVKKLNPEINNGLEIIIASGDHDTLQLVDGDRVRVYTMRRGIKDTVLYDEEQVRGRYKFAPEFLTDYKGLRGDPSDNIPGVAGIGEKTATDLIQKYGSIETILETAENNPDEMIENGIRKSVVSKLNDQATAAKFSKELAVIRTDAPIDVVINDLDWREKINKDELQKLVNSWQFKSLFDRLAKAVGWLNENSKTDSMFGSTGNTEEIDDQLLAESQLMVWLLDSDQTNPNVAEIKRVTGKNTVTESHKVLKGKIKQDELDQVYNKIEKPLIPVINRMNEMGIGLDVKFLKDLQTEYKTILEKIEQDIYKIINKEINLNSPKQLSEILFDDLGLPKKGIKKTSTGNYSTAESELEKLSGKHEVISLILRHRELAKLINTYITPLPKLTSDDGRLRAQFVQWGTTTGRLSSRSPNMQNIPIRSDLGSPIRKAFVASSGKTLVAIDYSQIELRIAAWLSGDPVLQNVFSSGRDVHAQVASDMFNFDIDQVSKSQRSAAKTINYGILYGMGANALRANLNHDSENHVTKDQAVEYLDKYFSTYQGLAKYLEATKRSARKNGYTTTYFGRRRYFKTIKSKLPYLRAQAERMAINAPIQGTQADIIKLAMVNISNWLDKNNLRDQVSVLLQVHDELVFEVNKDVVDKIVPQLVEMMESVIPIDETDHVCMKADAKIGPNWGELESIA